MNHSAALIPDHTLSILLLAALAVVVVAMGVWLILRQRAGKRNWPALWAIWGVLLCLLALILIASVLAGRGPLREPVPVELAYETAPVSFTEPHGEIYSMKSGWTVKYGGVTYCFANGISKTDRNAVVNETVSILSRMEDKVGAFPGGYTLCMREDNYLPRVSDHTLYIGLENFRTQEYAVGIAQMIFGNGMPYGLEYALGTDVARELGYSMESVDVGLAEALELYDTAPEYLDMNYACFLDAYADGETLPRVKALALGFYEHLLQNGETDLYTEFSPERYRAYLNEFLSANGRGEYDNSDLDGTAFYNGGTEIRLAWENSDGIFYVTEGYTANYKSGYGKDMINSGYADLRKIVVDYIAQAAYMRDKLKDCEIAPEPVTVLFTRNSDYDYYHSAVYLNYNNEIQMYATEIFMHEYCHYLMRGKEIEDWLQECICDYYSYYPVNEQITPLWYNDMQCIEALDPNDPEDAEEYAFVQTIESHLGREIDWYSMDDYVYWANAYIVEMNLFDALTDGSKSYFAKISFFHYLAGLQGEQAALEAIIDNSPYKAYGKTWNSLARDWKAYVAEKFAWAKDEVTVH